MRGLLADFQTTRDGVFTVDLSLEIPPGRTVALLGPNGAGKSTVVDALAGLLMAAFGRIELDGIALDDPEEGVFVPPEKRGVGVVFQDHVLFPHMTVLDNVAFGLRSRGSRTNESRQRALDMMSLVGIEDLGGRKPGELSGGQAQRVALARALAVGPDLLVLDEPFASVDVEARGSLRRVLEHRLTEFAGPRLIITHEPADAFLLADEIVVMEGGAISQRGTADEIRLRPRTPYSASVAGVNLVSGHAVGGKVDIDGHQLEISDHDVEGPVLVVIRPTAISVHLSEPGGSARNVWETRVEAAESYGDVVRLMLGPPLSLAAEVTRSAVEALGINQGLDVWVAIKATEIAVEPDE